MDRGGSAVIERQVPFVVADSVVSSTITGGWTFSQWLRAQLKARKLTQRQLAQKSGIDHSTISRLVRGDRTPSLRTANLLARSLGMGEGLDGMYRLGPGSAGTPAARVEYALRLDDLLAEPQIRHIMNVYLAARLRQLRRDTATSASTGST
jgi:transcriptional regulator with XRE-family HTH domain